MAVFILCEGEDAPSPDMVREERSLVQEGIHEDKEGEGRVSPRRTRPLT